MSIPSLSTIDAEPAELWVTLCTTAQSALPDFLLQQRWYPAKDAGEPTVRLATVLPLAMKPPLQAALAIWQVTPPGRSALRLFVPLALVAAASAEPAQIIANLAGPAAGGTAVALVDACSVDEFLQAWVELVLGGEGEAGGLPEPLRRGRTERLKQLGIHPSDRQIRRSRAEQSNTSVRIGTRAVLKVFRKLETGPHPEVEVGRYLAVAGYTASPPLLSWIEVAGNPAGSGDATLSTLHSFVPNDGDGWKWILERLGRVVGGQLEALEETHEWLRTLARRTAELHRTFAAATEPDFRPEPVGPDDLQRWSEAARATAERAFAALETRVTQGVRDLGNGSGPGSSPLLSEVTALRPRLMDLIEGITELRSHSNRTRLHGDFHLGQILVSGQDALIIDFEGEPLRSMAERRAKHNVLRDVAGMLRSFSYAAEAAARTLPVSLGERERTAALSLLERWRKESSGAFVAEYFEAMQGVPSLPGKLADAEQLLHFFLLEKALYEVLYELANRPDWVSIPLKGVRDLVRQATDRSSRAHATPFGAQVRADGRVRFRLWGPSHSTVSVELDRSAAPAHPSRAGE